MVCPAILRSLETNSWWHSRVRLWVIGRRLFVGLLLFALFVVSPLHATAQDASCLHRTLPITVHDSHWLQFHGLTPEDFQAKFRGQPVKILSLHPDTRPHRIVVLLDTSGSMRGEVSGKEWKLASSVAAHFGQANLKSTSLALFLFSDKVLEQIDFAQGNSVIANRLLNIWSDPTYVKKNVRGTTALFDTISSALRSLGGSGYSDSVYVISDGGDNHSRSSFGNVRNALAAAGVRLHVTLLAPESLSSPQESMGAKDLSDLVMESGGLLVCPLGRTHTGYLSYDLAEDQRRALATQLSLMYLGMTNNDVIEIELPRPVDKLREWTLELFPATKKLYNDLWIAYPQQLAPCNPRPN